MAITVEAEGAGAVPAVPVEQARTPGALKLLASVTRWELKRLAASRSSWVMAGTALVGFVGILWVRHDWGLADRLVLFGTTTYGQLSELVYELMVVFGVVLPFLAADAVAHDYKQRMHELLMTTAIPTPIYIWGRYLASLLVSLGLAVIMIAAQWGTNLALSATDPLYPLPSLARALAFWGVIALPETILICSLCFALGAFFPRFTIATKLALCIAWVILAFDTDPRDVGWRAYWNPTGAGMATLLTNQLRLQVQDAVQSVAGLAGQARVALQVQQQMPDVRPWVGPYVAWVVFGVLLVALAAVTFRRFRDVLG